MEIISFKNIFRHDKLLTSIFNGIFFRSDLSASTLFVLAVEIASSVHCAWKPATSHGLLKDPHARPVFWMLSTTHRTTSWFVPRLLWRTASSPSMPHHSNNTTRDTSCCPWVAERMVSRHSSLKAKKIPSPRSVERMLWRSTKPDRSSERSNRHSRSNSCKDVCWVSMRIAEIGCELCKWWPTPQSDLYTFKDFRLVLSPIVCLTEVKIACHSYSDALFIETLTNIHE